MATFFATPLFGQSAPSQQNSAPPVETAADSYQLKVSTRLVLEDVVVLDHNDQPVRGLAASDFTLTEDGAPVVLRNFDEHAAVQTPAVSPKPVDLGPNVFTNQFQAPPGASLNILLIDTLNTPLASQSYLHQELVKYIQQVGSDTRIAIFRMGTSLHLLQGFTSDPGILRAAVEGQRGLVSSPLLDDPLNENPRANLKGAGHPINGGDTAAARMRMVYTLEDMDQLARYLSTLPGRKNLVWFSGSFPLYILPQRDDPGADFREEVRRTSNLMARSRVAVYPVDVRGIKNYGAFDSQNRDVPDGQNLAGAMDDFSKKNDSEHGTLDMIAEETGGKAFYNTNGLKEAVEKAVDFGEHYYTFAYTPANRNWDGGWRKIEIKSNKAGLHLSYRRGYFADAPEAAPTAQTKALPRSAMQSAMMHGSPDATQVLFNVMLVPADKPVMQLSPGAHPRPKVMNPPYRSYNVRLLVDMRSMKMTADAEGNHHANAELAVFVYDRDGDLVNSFDNRTAIDLPKSNYGKTLQEGARANLIVETPVKGDYFLRIGIHDLNSDGVGAVEVPVSTLKSFQEMQAYTGQKRNPKQAN